MARRTRTTVDTESTVDANTIPVTESTVETDATPATESTVPTVADITPESSSADVLAATGLTDVAARMVDTYRDSDAKGKAKIRKSVNDLMIESMMKMDAVTARAYKIISDMLVSGSAKSSEKVDINRVVAERVATLRLAATMIESGVIVPDGVDTGEINHETILTMVDEIMSTDKTVDMIKAAEKVAATKITRSGDRHSVSDYITRAFADTTDGTFLTVAQIITRGAESGSDYRPSSGAVSACLNTVAAGKKSIDGIRVDTRGALGAVKVG